MEWLNYHHLLYFWMVAKEGSIARACEKLRLAQPTISGQLRQLEESLGEKLWTKRGRRLVLSEVGQVVYGYAGEIFGLGRELQDVLKGRPRGRALRLVVGISDFMPKLLAYRVLQPVLALPQRVQLVCDEDTPDRLLADLAEHKVDVVLSESPVPPGIAVKAYSHLLGSCGVTVFGAARLAAKYRKRFPSSLDGAPFLLPMEGSTLRRSADQWFDTQGVRPALVGEFKDAALMKTFGQAGAGLLLGPTAIEKEIRDIYRVTPVGRIDAIQERFYAITVERRLKHPALLAVTESARAALFRETA